MSLRAAIKRSLVTIMRQSTPPGSRESIGSPPRSAVPVLRVRDVARTVAWYRRHLAFEAESYPAQPPHQFSILSRDGVQLMIRRAASDEPPTLRMAWDVYLRVGDGEIGRLYDGFRGVARITRALERTPDGDLEFEVEDSDHHRLCVSEHVTAA